MPDILKLAEITGRNITLALEPLRVQMAAMAKEIERLSDIEAVAKRAAEHVPAPKDGKDGKDGKDAEPLSADAVADAAAARFERRFADLSLAWERQARESVERAIDKIPAPKDGKDGKDALPVDELDIQHDGERSLTIVLGEKKHTITIPAIIYRGVWTAGDYAKGDAVTYGGTLWIAKAETVQTPGASNDWQMAVKKGRDGKDLRDNASAAKLEGGLKL